MPPTKEIDLGTVGRSLGTSKSERVPNLDTVPGQVVRISATGAPRTEAERLALENEILRERLAEQSLPSVTSPFSSPGAASVADRFKALRDALTNPESGKRVVPGDAPKQRPFKQEKAETQPLSVIRRPIGNADELVAAMLERAQQADRQRAQRAALAGVLAKQVGATVTPSELQAIMRNGAPALSPFAQGGP